MLFLSPERNLTFSQIAFKWSFYGQFLSDNRNMKISDNAFNWSFCDLFLALQRILTVLSNCVEVIEIYLFFSSKPQFIRFRKMRLSDRNLPDS